MKTLFSLRNAFVFSVLGVSAVASIGAAQAQAVTPPTSTEPGRFEGLFRDRERPALSSDPIIEEGAVSIEGARAGETAFILKSVVVEGSSAIPAEELSRHIYGEYIGQEVSLRTLQQVAAAITVYYRNKGYILTRAVVPPQNVRGGIAKIKVVEGFIDKVEVRGETSEYSDLIQRYADKIKFARPLRAEDLERYLLLAEDLPGVTARGVLRPSATTPGASDLVINVEQDHFEGSVSANNRGSRFVGPYQGGVTLTGNNLVGMYERTQIRGITTSETDELRYMEFLHEQQLGSEGTKALVTGSYTSTKPGSRLEAFQIEGDSISYNFGVEHPLLRSRQENWFVRANFDYRNSDSSVLNTSLYEDRVRVLRAETSYDFIDPFLGITRLDAAVGQGLDIFDTDKHNPNKSRANGRNIFTKLNIDMSRIQNISEHFAVFTAFSGQYSSDPLLASEEFAIGGAEFGSAYDPAEIAGDHGAAGRFELQFNGDADAGWVDSYQYYTFYDIGKVWNINALAGESQTSTLSSAGLGTRFNVFQDLSGAMEFAFPLTRNVVAEGSDGDHPRLFFAVDYRF